MKNIVYILLICSISLNGQVISFGKQKSNKITYGNLLFIDDGQSNSSKRTDTITLDDQYKVSLDNVYMLTNNNVFEKYQYGVNHIGKTDGSLNKHGYQEILLPVLAEKFDTIIMVDRGTASYLYDTSGFIDHNIRSDGEMHDSLIADIQRANQFITDSNIHIDHVIYAYNQGEADRYKLHHAYAYDTNFVNKMNDIVNYSPNVKLVHMLIHSNIILPNYIDTVNARKITATETLQTSGMRCVLLDLSNYTLGGDQLHYGSVGYTQIALGIDEIMKGLLR